MKRTANTTISSWPDELGAISGKDVLNGVLQQRDQRRADDRAKQIAGAADHRHHQEYSMLHGDVERRRADEAAHVSVKPAGNRGEQRGDHESDEPNLKRVDAERFDQRVAAAQRAHRPADARIQKIVCAQHDDQQDAPDQVVNLAAFDQ